MKKLFSILLIAHLLLSGCTASKDDVMKETETSVQSETEAETLYGITSEPTVILVCEESHEYSAPTLIFFEETKQFSFTYSYFSSYFAAGEYDVTESDVTLKTHDGNYTYVFKIGEDALIFDAKRSSELPKYKYGEGEEAQYPFEDGALFTNSAKNSSPVIDTVEFDIDEDGVLEECTLTVGPTSGLYTFCFKVTENGETEYDNVFYSNYFVEGFHIDENGKLKIEAYALNSDELIYMGVSTTGSDIVLSTNKGVISYCK